MLIELNKAVKRYNSGEMEVRALDGISLQIEQNCFVAVLGPSGCGKSTLLNILAGYEKLDEGEYRFAGQKVEDDHLLRNRVAMIFQDHQLLEYLSVRENLLLPSLYRRQRVEPARLKQVSRQLGIEGLWKRRPSQLSGGEKQRCGIARALLYDCRLILADEPTGSLDRANGQALMAIFAQLHSEGCSIIMVTHDRQLAERCQRIIRMEDGHVIAQ